MNKTDVAKLLTVVSGFDRRQVDELTVEAWHSIPEIAGAEYAVALRVVTDHHSDTAKGYFDVRALLTGLRKVTRAGAVDVEADVRSAKARGFVAADWPKRDALPDSVMARLRAARDADRLEASRYREVNA